MADKELSILVVDQNHETGELIEAVLESNSNNKIFMARNGEHGMISYQVNHQNLILVDLDITPEDGVTFAEKIRNTDEGGKDVSIILMATQAADDIIERAKSIGINDMLVKPFSFDHLAKHINFVVGS